MQTFPPQPVAIGARVTATAFTDCFGKFHPERRGLRVETVRLISGQSIPDYWRIKACGDDGWSWVEGAFDRFFRVEG